MTRKLQRVYKSSLEESIDLASLSIYINVEISGSCWKTWDGLDIGS